MRFLPTVLLGACCALTQAHAADLEPALARIAAASGGKVGVGLRVIESGEHAWLNRDGAFPMQSVYKLPIAMATLAAVDAGALELADEIVVAPSDLVGPGQHSPLRDKHPQGDATVTLRELLRYAIADSDGSASDVLLRIGGGAPAVMRYLKKIDVAHIEVHDTERELGRDPSAQYRNSATPHAALALLQALQAGPALSHESRALLLKLMSEGSTGAHRIRAGLPAGTPLAHKTGTAPTVQGMTAATNDIGLVTLPDGRHLAIAVFVSDAGTSEAVREQTIAQIARLAWDSWHAAKGGEHP